MEEIVVVINVNAPIIHEIRMLIVSHICVIDILIYFIKVYVLFVYFCLLIATMV